MVFSSLLFLFLFLPLVLLLHFVIPRWAKNTGLLLASLIFYSWGEHGYVVLMLLSITCNYIFGRIIEICDKRELRRVVLISAVVLNLLPLFYFKYSEFVVQTVLQFLHHFPISVSVEVTEHHLPIGISFFTFQALSYIIDVYRGTERAQSNIITMGLYISFFPQLIAGPIIRYKDIYKYLYHRVITLDDFSRGAERFVMGLAKKVLLANPMGRMADSIFFLSQDGLSTPVAWIGILCYTFQIYYDFSGYSDMAIGLGRMFGFRYLENFNYPYISRSVREFWQRWHISLSNWFKDYVYIPLGGNRVGNVRTRCNLLIVFFLCGFWHGASWNFIIWGLMHGFFLVLERGKFGRLLEKTPALLQHCYVWLVIVVTWTFFRAETLNTAISFLGILFTGSESTSSNSNIIVQMDFNFYLIFALSALFATPIFPWIKNHFLLNENKVVNSSMWNRAGGGAFRLVCFCSLFMLSSMNLANGSYNPFIYFRF
ncbi:MAG: MBOAT family protein [Bacteroidetes bacterium]|nr:MBOAT family protein [Bacteroidota bacterium]